MRYSWTCLYCFNLLSWSWTSLIYLLLSRKVTNSAMVLWLEQWPQGPVLRKALGLISIQIFHFLFSSGKLNSLFTLEKSVCRCNKLKWVILYSRVRYFSIIEIIVKTHSNSYTTPDVRSFGYRVFAVERFDLFDI